MAEDNNDEVVSLSLSLKKLGRDSKNCNLLFSNSSPDSASTLTLNANAREPTFLDLDTPSSTPETSTIKAESTSSPNETISNEANTGTPSLKEMLDEWTDNLDPALGEGHIPEPEKPKIKKEEEEIIIKPKEELMDVTPTETTMAALTPQVEVKDHLLRDDIAKMVLTNFDTVEKESNKIPIYNWF